jgi:hypothetical protein
MPVWSIKTAIATPILVKYLNLSSMVCRVNCANIMGQKKGHQSLQRLITLSQPLLAECTAHLPVPCQGARFNLIVRAIPPPSMVVLSGSAKLFVSSQSPFTTTLLYLLSPAKQPNAPSKYIQKAVLLIKASKELLQ